MKIKLNNGQVVSAEEKTIGGVQLFVPGYSAADDSCSTPPQETTIDAAGHNKEQDVRKGQEGFSHTELNSEMKRVTSFERGD